MIGRREPMVQALGYAGLRLFLKHVLVDTFFRHVDVVGYQHIPMDSPVIFVANHNNQFVDPMLLISAIPRVVRFLIAAKSLSRPLIGRLARMAQAIGVARPQDLVTVGSGTLSIDAHGTTALGAGTHFLTDLQMGFKIKTCGVELSVQSVESDTRCTVSRCENAVSNQPYKIIPKVDQSEVYQQVHSALTNGDCVGIFPEGGSHDRSNLMDLKPGVAIMALGAMQAGAQGLKIVPVGLTYFEPDKFRSRVVIEIGVPIEVPEELAQLYGTDKRQAVQELMGKVDEAMHGVVLGAPSYDQLGAVITARALWRPEGRSITREESIKITKTMGQAMEKLKDQPGLTTLVESLTEYNELLRATNRTDRDVRRNLVKSSNMFIGTILSALSAVLLAPPAIITAIFLAPVGIVSSRLAAREKKQALAASSVKVTGLDVVASYKLITGLILLPINNLILAVLAMLLVLKGLPGLGLTAPLAGRPTWVIFCVSMLVYWILIPIVEYLGIRLMDRWVRRVKFLRGSALFFFGKRQKNLLSHRTLLALHLRSFVEEHAPKVFANFEEERVIRRTSMKADTARLMRRVNTASFDDLTIPLLGRRTSKLLELPELQSPV